MQPEEEEEAEALLGYSAHHRRSDHHRQQVSSDSSSDGEGMMGHMYRSGGAAAAAAAASEDTPSDDSGRTSGDSSCHLELLELEVAQSLARNRLTSNSSSTSSPVNASSTGRRGRGFEEDGDSQTWRDHENGSSRKEGESDEDESHHLGSMDDLTDKTRLTVEERKQRSRERNRMHARKTRERKKLQMLSLQDHIRELREERVYLGQLVEEQDTASILLVMSGAQEESTSALNADFGTAFGPGAAEGTTKDRHMEMLEATMRQFASLEKVGNLEDDAEDAEGSRGDAVAGGARSSKSSCPLERQRIRRERNRMHAKRTRDRKKIFMEASEIIIEKMKEDNGRVRERLRSAGLLPADYRSRIIRGSGSASMALIEDVGALWDFSQGFEPGTTRLSTRCATIASDRRQQKQRQQTHGAASRQCSPPPMQHISRKGKRKWGSILPAEVAHQDDDNSVGTFSGDSVASKHCAAMTYKYAGDDGEENGCTSSEASDDNSASLGQYQDRIMGGGKEARRMLGVRSRDSGGIHVMAPDGNVVLTGDSKYRLDSSISNFRSLLVPGPRGINS